MYFQPLLAIRDRASRMIAFAIETHPPLVYALVAGGWSYSLMVMLTSLAGTPLPASAPWVGVVFFLALLCLRAIDEIKDLPYDRLHNPDRPLVRGAISEPEVASLATVVAVVVLGVSLCLSPLLAVLAALQLAYGLALLALERASRRFRDSILLNLCVTFPVSAVLNLYAWAYLAIPSLSQAWPVLALHMAVFLHMEFGRKLKWPQHAQAGENGYAQALGVRGAVVVCVLMGLAACALASGVHLQHGAGAAALLPWLALLPSVAGLHQFWRNRSRAQPRALKPWFGAAMVLFFLVNMLAAR